MAAPTGLSPWQWRSVVHSGVCNYFLLLLQEGLGSGRVWPADHGVTYVASLTSLEVWSQGSHPPNEFQWISGDVQAKVVRR
jgi:hypothetical protein